jgi:CheY-like chemotaxis protein
MNSMSAPANQPTLPTRQLVRQMRTAPQPTVLVVEDHEDTREMLHMLLEIWGCRVVEACNGVEAVEAASRERPQFICSSHDLI